jgi:myosin heavy subunit
MGILDLLDESSALGSSTDKAFLEKIFKTHAKNTNLVVPKIIKESFTIFHTAKNVEYYSVGFRAKNKVYF